MRKLFMLCAVGLWVGCGTGTESGIGADLADLGTNEARLCRYVPPSYLSDWLLL